MDDLQLVERLACSLGIGLLMGLERQREPSAYAGLRTFALVALFGSVSGWIAEHAGAPWILPAGLLAVAAMIVGAYAARPREDDPGTTTTAALMLCYGLGIVAWWGQLQLAVGIALAATALLQFKEELHGFALRLTRDEMIGVLQLVMVSALVLPVLPDRGYGPFEALNPYRIWLMVVLVSALSFGGYVLSRFTQPRKAVSVLGILGGLVSSTATTLGFSRKVRSDASNAPMAGTVILVANLTVLVRLAVLAAVLCPAILSRLIPVFGIGLAAGLLALRLGMPPEPSEPTDTAHPAMRNPGDLRGALVFGVLFALVQLAVAFLESRAGEAGVYLASALSGLTDLDAIALAVYDHAVKGTLTTGIALNALLIAYFANLVFKLATVAIVAGPALAMRVGKGFAAVAAGLLAAALSVAPLVR